MPSNAIVVLLVDDQEIIGEAIRRILVGEEDMAYHFCKDPTQAIEMAIQHSPTVILQDLMMPDLDGFLLLRYFRANAKTKEIPLIVLSSKDDEEIRKKVMELGATDYMIKIPKKDELINKVRYYSQQYVSRGQL